MLKLDTSFFAVQKPLCIPHAPQFDLSRSFKVKFNNIKRKPIGAFLLMSNSNYVPKMNPNQDMKGN